VLIILHAFLRPGSSMLYLQAELPLRNADTVLHGVVEETYIHATLPRTNNLGLLSLSSLLDGYVRTLSITGERCRVRLGTS
jgi:hypothetical protein